MRRSLRRGYLAEAKAALEAEDTARAEARIQERAAQMQHADEREARHAALRAKHGLHDAATPREISDAWTAEQTAFKEYVVHKHGSLALHILSDDVPLADTAPQSLRDHVAAAKQTVRAEFEAQYVHKPLPPSAIDSASQGRAHNTGVAA